MLWPSGSQAEWIWPPREHLAMSGDASGDHNGRGSTVLFASNGRGRTQLIRSFSAWPSGRQSGPQSRQSRGWEANENWKIHKKSELSSATSETGELDHSQILGSAFFLAHTRVCKQGCVCVMPCCCLHLLLRHCLCVQGCNYTGCEAGQACECVNGRGGVALRRVDCSRVASVHFSAGIPKAVLGFHILLSRGFQTSQKPVTFWKSYLVLTVGKENEGHSL